MLLGPLQGILDQGAEAYDEAEKKMAAMDLGLEDKVGHATYSYSACEQHTNLCLCDFAVDRLTTRSNGTTSWCWVRLVEAPLVMCDSYGTRQLKRRMPLRYF